MCHRLIVVRALGTKKQPYNKKAQKETNIRIATRKGKKGTNPDLPQSILLWRDILLISNALFCCYFCTTNHEQRFCVYGVMAL